MRIWGCIDTAPACCLDWGVHRCKGILANLHVSGSINNLVRLVYPRPEGSKCLLPHHLSRWNPAFRVGQSDFPVNERVIETDLGRVTRGVSEIHVREATPVDGTEAHGAGFARSVQFAIHQLKIAQFTAGLPDRYHFRMSRGIVRKGHTICALAYNRCVLNHDRPKWSTTAALNGIDCELDSAHHELVFHL